jgi:hypothetical protein
MLSQLLRRAPSQHAPLLREPVLEEIEAARKLPGFTATQFVRVYQLSQELTQKLSQLNGRERCYSRS